MAIISNWSKPLVDVLLKKLNNPGLTFHDYRELRRQCHLLDGAPGSELLIQKLEKDDKIWDQKYQKTVETARQSSDLSEVRDSLQMLKSFSGYLDADRIYNEVESRFAILQKEEYDRRAALRNMKEQHDRQRKRIIHLVIIAAAVILVVFIAIAIHGNVQKKQRITAELEKIRSAAEAGQQVDAIEALKALPQEDLDYIESYPDWLYAITQTMIEKNVRDNGYQAGFELYNQLIAELPKMVSKDGFESFMIQQLSGENLSPAEKWEWLLAYRQRGISVSSETCNAVMNECVASLPADEAWAFVADGVENGMISPRDNLAKETYKTVQKALPAKEAWETAQRAVALNIIKDSDNTYKTAFQNYVDSTVPFEAWSIIASQYGSSLVGSTELFNAFKKYSALASAEEAAEMLRTMVTVEDGKFAGFVTRNGATGPYIDQELKAGIQTRYLNAIADELAAGTDRNIPEWASVWSDAMAILPAEPDAALRLAYALNDAGYDVYKLFPKGICLNLPMAERVYNLLDRKIAGTSSTSLLNTDKVLPVSLVQDSKSIVAGRWTNEIRVQRDCFYNTCLSTEHLFKLPEAMRPATYEECQSLLCMQTVYWMNGYIRNETTRGDQTSISRIPLYDAIGLVAVYSLDDVNTSEIIYAKSYKPQSSDDEWFELNKKSDIVLEVENCVGIVDLISLKQEFQSIVENAEILQIYILISGQNISEEEANDAD